jgi:hypothetical protein
MPIKVLVNSIDSDMIQQIIDYYNSNKPIDEFPIERLNRAEGGFKIVFSTRPDLDPNDNCRQLRWNRGKLVSGIYIGFTPKQETLLYNAFAHVMGENVKIEP